MQISEYESCTYKKKEGLVRSIKSITMHLVNDFDIELG